jgi:hypothetical protein
MALLDDIASYLQAQGLGVVATNIFKGTLPQDAVAMPDEVIALRETPGLPPARSHDIPPARIEQPTVQVLVRGAPFDYATARQKAQAAWEALDGLGNQTIGTGFYLFIQALQSPFPLRMDALDRYEIVFNLRLRGASSVGHWYAY